MSQKQHEAERLARVIRNYWKARGKSPLVWVARQMASSSSTDFRYIFGVRSDMVGGWPRTFPATPKPIAKISYAPMPDSPSPFAALAGMGQRLFVIESHGPSNRLWCDVGGKGGGHVNT
jgi:hypothetical protein